MNYPYDAENRLETPHSYMYTPFGGRDFLSAYVFDRRARLTQLLLDAPSLPHVDPKDALLATARALASESALVGFSAAESVTLQPLLAGLLCLLARGDVATVRPWLNRIIQRFEVNKKLYAVYAPGFRKGEGEARDPGRYFELALCLALAHSMTGHLQYLSTMLKLVDLLLSLDASTLLPACPPERLALLVEAELDAVRILALAQGVTFDVA